MEHAVADDRLLAIFLEELDERVRALNDDALALDNEASEDAGPAHCAERVSALLRTAHSLKGAARSVNLGPVERACHLLEEVLLAVQSERVPAGRELCALLLAAADAIEDAGARVRARQDLDDASITRLLPRLEAAAAGGTAPLAAPPALDTIRPGEGAGADGAVRVAAERLDALLAHTGELLVARRRVESRRADVAALREVAARCRTEWPGSEKVLHALAARAGAPAPVPRRVVRAAGRTGELLRQLEADVERLATAMDGDARLLAQTAAPLDDDVRRLRMLPFAEACVGLERTVHDLGRAGGKEVALVVQGGDVELDRSVIEGIKDPLRHLVRNAVDHGIEPPDTRRTAGRPAQGRITVAAALRGAHVEVTVSDDGRGLDLARLAERARAAGLPVPGDARELARLVFEPGVSTAHAVTDVSGRGVGLDVVKTRIESLHGTADVAAGAGPGARFTLTVPLTLTTLNVLLVAAGGQTFALASASVGNLLRLGPGDLRVVCGREMLPRGGALVPVVRLADALGVGARGTPSAGGKAPAVVLAAGEQRVAFVVDELVATQDVVVKALGRRLRRMPAVSGATILPSGRVALVLNAAHLIRRALGGTPGARLAGPTPGAVPARKRVLLADDSLTTRALERSLLEAAGYDVVVAADGAVAWRVLQDDVPDLVVSDVEMPGMDGFALTEAIRSSPRLRDLPVVLLTGRERTEDKARGLRAGASAYLVKSAFDQKAFLDTLARLL